MSPRRAAVALGCAALVSAARAGAATAAPPGDDLAAARIAWRYFERNYHPETGLVSSVEGFPSTSVWDAGSTLIATVAARELDLLASAAFDARIAAMLRTLETAPLLEGELPNKAYDAATARMTDYGNRPAPRGIGFSALDLGRLVSALELVAGLHPVHRPAVDRVLARWRWCRLLGNGELHGAYRDRDGRLHVVQEGRFGYEQYAARAFALLGLDVRNAERYDRFVAETAILGVPVPHDTRHPRKFGAVDALVTEPWVLGALEFGVAPEAEPLLRRIFDVQKRRFETSGIVTAASEDHLDRAPWFVYNAIWAAGEPWRAVTPDGDDAPGARSLSTKAAFALATLYPEDPYARVLRDAVERARDPERGWYAGVYEDGRLNRSLSANTNAVVLEAVLYEHLGPLHDACAGCGARAPRILAAATATARPGACLPGSAEAARAAAIRPPAAPLEPVLAPAAPDLAPARPAAAPPRRARRNHVTGAAYLAWRGMDGALAGAIATVSPFASTFLRVGVEGTPMSEHGPVRFLWGVGYDDWRDGTLSLHVHNWGPVRPDDGLAVDGAELGLGYKLPRLCGGAFCLLPQATAIVPFAGGPYVGGRATLSFRRMWFAMGGVGWTIPGVHEASAPTPKWRVVYGIGRLDWKPGSLFVTYHDWGPTWRAGNGILAIGVNYGF